MSTSNFKTEVSSLSDVKNALNKSALVVVRGQADLSEQSLLNFARSLSDETGPIERQLLHWEFGPIMRMRLDPNAKNYLFSSEAVPLHWDGAFYTEPRFLLFHCLESQGAGGETIFTSTESMWKDIPEVRQQQMSKVFLTYTTEKRAHYGGQVKVPLVQSHPRTGRTILRFAEEVETQLNPVELKIASPLCDGQELYKELKSKAYQAPHCYAHSWTRGDLVIADNFSLIHGRAPLKENVNRSFNRIQIL